MNRSHRHSIQIIAALAVIIALLSACRATTAGSGSVRAPGTIDDSVVSIAPDPETTAPADPYELPPRPQALTLENCFPKYGENVFVWEAGDPNHDPGLSWVLKPSPDRPNEALVWPLEPRHAYSGYYLAIGDDDGQCRQYPLTFEDGDFAGGLAIDAKAWTYQHDVVTFAVIALIDEPAPDPGAPQTV